MEATLEGQKNEIERGCSSEKVRRSVEVEKVEKKDEVSRKLAK